MFDSYKRDIRYLRISITDKCNLRCTYCMPEEGVKALNHSDLLSFEQITEIVREAVKIGFTKIRLTGGEPLVRNGVVSLVEMIHGVEGVEFLGMTSNALLLPEFARPLKKAGLDALNLSLDTLNPEKYAELTRWGSLESALNGIDWKWRNSAGAGDLFSRKSGSILSGRTSLTMKPRRLSRVSTAL